MWKHQEGLSIAMVEEGKWVATRIDDGEKESGELCRWKDSAVKHNNEWQQENYDEHHD